MKCCSGCGVRLKIERYKVGCCKHCEVIISVKKKEEGRFNDGLRRNNC